MRTKILILLAVACLSTVPSRADVVSGADKLICAAVQATGCFVDEDCIVATPSYFNIPHFIEIDLKNRMLSTTHASNDYRTTPIEHLTRDEGLIALHGSEFGRVFSFVITEETGTISAAVAADGVTISVFGACTPAEK